MASIISRNAAVLLLAGFAAVSGAAETAGRPRIGLVLGGGGARGTAHIGILEVLEELRVPVDCVAGTSMGALVAGSYAGGLDPREMKDRLSRVDWRDLFRDDPSHAETNYREKRLSQNYYPGLEMGKTEEGLKLAHGIVGGQKIKLFFNTLVGADRGERPIESLPLPLSIIATDIGTGERVVFREGDLSTAMRASMSVPTLLAPVPYQGRRLVDGGLVDNLPIAEARQRCKADVVIAVDVGTQLMKPEEVTNVLAVTGQMINILTEQNVTASRAQLKPDDIFIQPDLTGITAADFDKFREGAERGRRAAEAVADKLRRYGVAEADYLAWQGKLKTEPAPLPRIDEIQVAGLKHVNPEMVRKHLHVRPGERLDTVLLEGDIGRIYGEGDFEAVDYQLLTTRERNILRITPTEKSWGPNYLRFGVEMEASSKQNEFALRAAYHRKWLNRLGGEWLTGGQMGERATLFTEFYQPLDARQRFFIEPALSIARDNVNIYQDDERIAEYQVREQRAILNLGANIGVLGQFRLGRQYAKTDSSIETGLPSLPTGETQLKGWQAILDFDRFDRAFFPTKGWAARTTYYRDDDLGYSKLGAHLRAAYSWGPYVLNGRLSYVASPTGKLPIADAGTMGGFLNLSGYVRNQFIADDIRFAGIRGEKIIGRMPLGLAGDLRAGISLEAGRAGGRFTETNRDGWQEAVALYLGGETPLGPVYLGVGKAKGGPAALYLFIGLP